MKREDLEQLYSKACEKNVLVPRKFMTNSMHCSVFKKMSPFQKIDVESKLTGYSQSGCITYVEIGDKVQDNPEALEQIVDYGMNKNVPYLAINVANDRCACCGYIGIIKESCPRCSGNDIARLRRVTGYLTGSYTEAFNEGKQQEVRMRVKHSDYMSNKRFS